MKVESMNFYNNLDLDQLEHLARHIGFSLVLEDGKITDIVFDNDKEVVNESIESV